MAIDLGLIHMRRRTDYGTDVAQTVVCENRIHSVNSKVGPLLPLPSVERLLAAARRPRTLSMVELLCETEDRVRQCGSGLSAATC